MASWSPSAESEAGDLVSAAKGLSLLRLEIPFALFTQSGQNGSSMRTRLWSVLLDAVSPEPRTVQTHNSIAINIC